MGVKPMPVYLIFAPTDATYMLLSWTQPLLEFTRFIMNEERRQVVAFFLL